MARKPIHCAMDHDGFGDGCHQFGCHLSYSSVELRKIRDDNLVELPSLDKIPQQEIS